MTDYSSLTMTYQKPTMCDCEQATLLGDSAPIVNHGSIDDTKKKLPLPEGEKRQGFKVWLTFLVAVLLGLVSGTLYGFGRYSRDLRNALGLSQMAVQKFGIMLDTGNYIGHPLTGLIYDHFGPKVSCILAAIVVFSSYLSIHLGLYDAPLWGVDLGFFGVGFGSGLGYIAALGSTTGQFLSTPHLGRAIGTVAASYGFSSTLVGISYHEVGLEYFFLLWALLVAVVNILGATVFTGTMRDDVDSVEATELASTKESEDDSSVESLSERCSDDAVVDVEVAVQFSDGQQSPSWTTWRRLDFWLLFASFACITGCGLFVINNVSTMVESIDEDDHFAGALIILLSTSNVYGRILMGFLDDYTSFEKLDLYRYSSLTMATALLVSAFGGTSGTCLAFTVGLSAFAYGGSWVLIVGMLADFYGKDNFGKDYGLIAMGPAVSGMIFNTISAQLYQKDVDESLGICLGASCYRDAYIITGVSALIGFSIISTMQFRR